MNASASTHDETPSEEQQAVVDRFAALSHAYAQRGDARLALLAMWGSDVELLQLLLWESGLGEAPDPLAQLTAVGEAVLGSLSFTTTGAAEGITARQTVERSREAMVAAFDESVHALLVERFLPLDHLDALPWPAPSAAGQAADRRLAGRTPHELIAGLQTTAADCMAVAEVMLLEEDAAGALGQARQADLASFEAYLVTAAVRAGDTALASVDLRWDLAAMSGLDDRDQPDDFEKAVAAWRDRLLGLVGSAEAETLRAAFEPVPAR